jgi:DNA-binding transcriptional regulator LsrR (DeoR family)
MTKKQLAENFGVNRTSLSRELKKMKNEGLIDFDNKLIEIKDSSILD